MPPSSPPTPSKSPVNQCIDYMTDLGYEVYRQPSMPPVPTLPPPAAPPADFPIPKTGVQVLDGALATPTQLACLHAGKDELTTTSFGGVQSDAPGVPGAVIAAQCCRVGKTDPSEACMRYIGANDEDGCIGGLYPPTPMTYSEAAARCAQRSKPDDAAIGTLALCNMTCANKGCFYNKSPVYSALPCAPP